MVSISLCTGPNCGGLSMSWPGGEGIVSVHVLEATNQDVLK